MYVCNLHSGGGGGDKGAKPARGRGKGAYSLFIWVFLFSRPRTFVLSHKKGESLIAG